MTLGNAAAAQVRLIVWCLDHRHQVQPDRARSVESYGAEMGIPDWRSPTSLLAVSTPLSVVL